ncbi:MAG: hypothetical protein AAF682_23045 [Planctomycetota bacterium]
MGLALLGVGWLLATGFSARGLLSATGALLVAAGADELLRFFEAARQPQVELFTWMGWLAARLAGADVAVEGRTLLFEHTEGAFQFTPTLGLIGLRPLLTFWVLALLALAPSAGSRLRSAVLALAVPLLAFGVRYAYLCLRFVEADQPLNDLHHLALSLFWDPWGALATLGVTALLLAALLPPLRPAAEGGPLLSRATPLAAAAGLLLGAAFGWQDAGAPRRGRVLIDDQLSGVWEPAGRLLTPDRYGDFSAYSFASLVEHVARRFAVTVHGQGAYTREVLDGFDVLLLKTPHERLEPAEVSAIQGWVEDGGGLFVIGDHTDLGGMGTHLNQLVDPYGISFAFNSTGRADGGAIELWEEPWRAEHPISAGLDRFEVMSGCSITLTGTATPVLTMRRSWSMAGDYSRGSNFGAMAAEGTHAHGQLVVAAAADAGRGRVVAFGDSTVLSSFSYFHDSHAEFVVRSIAWLNGSAPLLPWTRIAALVLAALALGGWAMRVRERELATSAGVLSLGFLAAAWGAARLAGMALTVPSPGVPVTTVGFVVEGGYAWLPAVIGGRAETPDDGDFATFTQVPLKLGMETRIVPRDPAQLDGLDVLVLLNPDTEHGQSEADPEWVAAVRAWAEAGGTLVVTKRAGHDDHDHGRAGLYVDGVGLSEVEGVPFVRLERGVSGAGDVLLLTGTGQLSYAGVGHCMALPTAPQRERLELAYGLFEDWAGNEPIERRTYRP